MGPGQRGKGQASVSADRETHARALHADADRETSKEQWAGNQIGGQITIHKLPLITQSQRSRDV